MTHRFDKFLMDNGVYREYNVNAGGLKGKDPYLYVSSAFIWRNTPEGHSFWFDISDRWRDIVLAEEEKYRIEQKQQKQKEEGCSFCNGKSKIESTAGDNWVKIRLLKDKSILNIELEGYCDECDENMSFYSTFDINYCPMCGNKLTNN